MKWIVFSTATLFVVGVLAYGYRFNATHGALYIDVLDVTDGEHVRDVRTVQLTFRDHNGGVLAGAAGAEQSGAIFLTAPAEYSCHEVELRGNFSIEAREEWTRCFDRQSKWLPTWVRDVRFVDIISDSCTIERMPVSLSEHPDTWWLWWVPLRHIGGKPYTSFSFSIRFSRDACGR